MTIDPKKRARFESTGIAAVRADIASGNYLKDPDALNQAREWLAEQHFRNERRQTLRFMFIIILSGIATLAAVIRKTRTGNVRSGFRMARSTFSDPGCPRNRRDGGDHD